MQIRVRLYAGLALYRPKGAEPNRTFDLEVPEGTTVRGVAVLLAIPPAHFRIAAVNGNTVDVAFVLKADDELLVAPAASGGSR